jgi:hypothetical protein
VQKTGPNPFKVIFSGQWATALFLFAQTPSGRNVNYDEKQFSGKKNELFLQSVQVS